MPAPTTSAFWNSLVPAPPAGQQNVKINSDGSTPEQNISEYDPIMVGDTGSGGLAGNVPAPAAGDAAAGKVLGAAGTWVAASAAVSWVPETPAGAMNGVNKVFTLSFTPNPASSLFVFLNGVEQTPTDITVSGATITYTFPPESTDIMRAQYTH